MKIDVILNHKQCQPEIEGVRSLPESYTITVTRSDACGISTPEVMTALQTCLSGLEDPYFMEDDEFLAPPDRICRNPK